MTSIDARKYFGEFVEVWNARKLPMMYYDGIKFWSAMSTISNTPMQVFQQKSEKLVQNLLTSNSIT
jgi:hypothetical protein